MKTIIFDFDGTLTEKHKNVWRFLWQELGFDTTKNSAYATLYTLFIRNKITHHKWCDLTCYFFQKKKMNKVLLDKAIEHTPLLPDCLEFLKILKEQGYDLHIVSGCISDVINGVLNNGAQYITKINANEMIFDKNNNLQYIKGTPYDYEGKALYIQKLINEKGIAPSDILFIGNGDNDEFVHQTGCHTLCINAETKNANNTTIWNNSIETNSLKDLIPLINSVLDETKEK